MKILKYILALMLMLPFLASCDDDEVGNPNVSPQDFVTVSNRTARVSLDDASGMYVLDEYVKADTLNYETCIFLPYEIKNVKYTLDASLLRVLFF